MAASQDQIRQLHQRAAQAATAGQWQEAATLLERCCKLTRYTSSPIHSQWMVAADRAGKESAETALEFARNAWQIGSRDGALEFLQLALFKNLPKTESRAEALECARAWLTAIAQESAHEQPPLLPHPQKKIRIGHLLGLLNPTHAPTKLVRLLVSQISREDADSCIYASEWAAAWYHNWTHPRQSGPEDFLQEFKPASLYIQEAQGGFIDRARQLSERIRRDAIDVLIVHSSLTEMITSLVAMNRPARRLVNINHASEMNLPCFDGVVHMFENGLLRTGLHGVPAAVIPPASDMDLRVKQAPGLSKHALGIPESATVSGTFGNLYKVDNPAYQASLRAIMQANPSHHHLIAGGGEDQGVRGFLENAALSDRVHLLGRRTDIPSLLLLLDFYLASHPYPGALSEIEAMAAACPVISVRDLPESHHNAGAEVVGLAECIVNPGDTSAITALATRYLQNPAWRRETGRRLKSRFDQLYTPAGVVARHLAFYRSLINPILPAMAHSDPDQPGQPPIGS